MNNTKHTPGPWKAVPDRSRNLYTWYVEGAKGVVPAIARLSLIDACEEIEGNAHLIAAAPAMYEALQGCLRVAQAYLHDTLARWEDYEGKVPSGIAELDAAHMEVARIRAALSQAEGKQ